MPLLLKDSRKKKIIWNEIQSQVVTLFEAGQFFAFYLRSCLLEIMTHALKPCSRQHRIPEKHNQPTRICSFYSRCQNNSPNTREKKGYRETRHEDVRKDTFL